MRDTIEEPGINEHHNHRTGQKTYRQLLGRTLPHIIRTEEQYERLTEELLRLDERENPSPEEKELAELPTLLIPKLRTSPRARTDLIEIWTYIADDSETNADAFVDRLCETIQILGRHRGSGRSREEWPPGILSFPFARYVIFYRSATDATEVVRVLHGARDIENIFEG
jgi:toxin ParE1/3/4